MFKKTEVWSISDFMAEKEPTRVEGGVPDSVKIAVIKGSALYLIVSTGFGSEYIFAADGYGDGPVSKAFDQKIWPLMLDIGKPLAKTMMCIGIYKCIRNDVENGWKMTWRSAVGLAALFLIDGAIDIVSDVGGDLSSSSTEVHTNGSHR